MTGPVRDFVLDTTTTGGTGTMALAGNPPLGFKGFDAYSDGAVVYYARRGDPQDVDAGKIETGRGTVGVSGTVTLSRDQVFESSNNDELVAWTEGVVSHVFVFVPAAITGRMLASNAATARPADLPPRGTWLDISGTPWIWKLWDGSTDIPIGTFDPSGDTFTPYRHGTLLGDAAVRTVGAGSGNLAELGAGGTFALGRIPLITTAKGGTGRSTLTAGRLVAGAGTSAVSILDAGGSGQFLRSNGEGSNPSWQSVDTTPPNATISQAKLKTTTGDVTAGADSGANLPGGTFGFYPTTTGNVATVSNRTLVLGKDSYANIGLLRTATGSSPQGLTFRQRYVQASPPYDLGDGEVALFVFVMVEKSTGKVAGAYAATEAPWHYNGPTDIRADGVDGAGRPVKRMKPALLEPLPRERKALEGYLDRVATEADAIVEITQELKNRDMGLIPQPWPDYNTNRYTVVLLDPVAPLLERLAHLHLNHAPERTVDLLLAGALKFDNEALTRAGPPGLDVVRPIL